MKTPLVIALSVALTTTTIFAAMGIYSLVQRDPSSPTTPTPASSGSPAPIDPITTATPVVQVSPSPLITWTQAENDYLYDLSQALQPQERDRTTPAGKLAIGRQIQGWLEGGADYWGVREKFDAAYKGTVLDHYAHNRDVYIKFATERLAASHLDTLTPPPQVIRVPVEVPVYPKPDQDSNQNNVDFDGGNPIPEREATVIEAGSLNCRAIPNGKIIGQVYEGDVIQVNRVAQQSGKQWYFAKTQGCWLFGSGIQLKSSIDNPEPNPLPGQYATVTASGSLNCRATPKGKVVGSLSQGETIRVTKVDHGTGEAWYLTEKGCWVAGQFIQLDRVR